MKFSSQQVLLLIATLAISTAAPLFRQLDGMSPLLAASLRLLLAGGILCTMGGLRFTALTSTQFKATWICGFFYAAHFGCWVSSLHYTSIAASVTLVTTTPILLLALSLMKGEKRQPGEYAACAVAMLGVCFLAGADWQLSSRALFGDFLALMGAVAMAGYFLVVKPLGQLPLRPFMCLTALFAGGLLMLIALFENPNALSAIEHQDWLWIGALAILPHLVGHGLLTYCLRNSSPSEVALATVGEPAGSALLAYLLFSETVSLFAGVGCMITLAAVYVGTQAPSKS